MIKINNTKIAIVVDWLVTYAGAERVVEQILELYPHADLFSLVDFLEEKDRHFIKGKHAKTSFIQSLPFAKKKYRSYLPLMPLAIEQFDLTEYDIIISSSHCVAKGVITSPDQLHVCYIHTPIRYAWDLKYQYLKEMGWNKGLKALIANYFLHKIRIWDFVTASSVDSFVANSKFISKRVLKFYRRASEVIYPPVSVEDFDLYTEKEDFYVTASRMVPYKKHSLIIEAFSQMPDKKLIVIGDGPDFRKNQTLANGYGNITLLGHAPFHILKHHMQRAKAFVFVAKEDFGIVPVEAQSCGTPVIAFGEGGAKETVKDSVTGVLFYEQSVESLIEAVHRFESIQGEIRPENCRENATNFSAKKFRQQFSEFMKEKWHDFQDAKQG